MTTTVAAAVADDYDRNLNYCYYYENCYCDFEELIVLVRDRCHLETEKRGLDCFFVDFRCLKIVMVSPSTRSYSRGCSRMCLTSY